MDKDSTPLKPVDWLGNTRKVLKRFPKKVCEAVGFALHHAQKGEKHESAKPMRGFRSAGVLEIIEDHDGNTYRAVYTVRFRGWVYVLHMFQKKSKKGIKTPKEDIEIIKRRLKEAEELHKSRE